MKLLRRLFGTFNIGMMHISAFHKQWGKKFQEPSHTNSQNSECCCISDSEHPHFQHLNKASIQVNVGHVAKAGSRSKLISERLSGWGTQKWDTNTQSYMFNILPKGAVFYFGKGESEDPMLSQCIVHTTLVMTMLSTQSMQWHVWWRLKFHLSSLDLTPHPRILWVSIWIFHVLFHFCCHTWWCFRNPILHHPFRNPL